MEIALLIAEPNMSGAAVDQRYFVLDQVPVLGQGGSWRNLLRPSDEMLGTVVFRADFEHELGRSWGTLIHVNAASAHFAFGFFQEKGFGGDFCGYIGTGLFCLRERTDANHR